MKDQKLEQLFEQAKLLQENAYVPYSHFRVGAIVILNDDMQISGVNVENAAYTTGICAERTALSQVVTKGYKKEQIIALFLITDSKSIGSPCGFCRQFMIEIMPLDADVFISNSYMQKVKEIKKVKVKDLLPFAFLPESLKE